MEEEQNRATSTLGTEVHLGGPAGRTFQDTDLGGRPDGRRTIGAASVDDDNLSDVRIIAGLHRSRQIGGFIQGRDDDGDESCRHVSSDHVGVAAAG